MKRSACERELDKIAPRHGAPTRAHAKVTAVWLRRIGDHVEVLVEIDGQFHQIIREYYDGSFSHIAEAGSHWTASPPESPR